MQPRSTESLAREDRPKNGRDRYFHNPRYGYGPFYSPQEAELIAFYSLQEGVVLKPREARRRIRAKRLEELREPSVSGRAAAFALCITPGDLYRLIDKGVLQARRVDHADGGVHLEILAEDLRAYGATL